MLSCLYYSSSDSFNLIVGIIMIIIVGFACCSSLSGDDSSSNTSYRPRTYNSNRNYNEDEYINTNWDDSWDDKWLHQGEYADDAKDTPPEYSDYDPSWDEHFRD